MRAHFRSRKWQIISFAVVLALGIPLGFGIYWHSNHNSNIVNGAIVVEKVFNEDFKLTMIIQNETYVFGEPINFTLKLSNIGNESMVIYYNTMDLLRYRVISPSGDLIYFKSEAPGDFVPCVIVPENLGPSMAHETFFTWRQVYRDYSPETYPSDEKPITTSGTYTIIGQTHFYLNRSLPAMEAKVQVEVQIT